MNIKCSSSDEDERVRWIPVTPAAARGQASVREFHIKAPASPSASDTLCLNDTVSSPPVFSRKHFPAVEIQNLVYGSDSSFQNVPDR